jgi:hypothetical protein
MVSTTVTVVCQDCGEEYMHVMYVPRGGDPVWLFVPRCRTCECTRAILVSIDAHPDSCDTVTPEL